MKHIWGECPTEECPDHPMANDEYNEFLDIHGFPPDWRDLQEDSLPYQESTGIDLGGN